MDAKAIIEMAREHESKFVDVKFQDIIGMWQRFTVPARTLTPDFFSEGRLLEGSTLKGFQGVASCAIGVLPDPSTARFDPFTKARTLSLIGCLVDPATGRALNRDPRSVAKRAEEHLKASGTAETALFAPETEFYVFDEVRYDQTRNSGYYHVDSEEGRNQGGREEGLGAGYRQHYREAYFPAPPADGFAEIRQEIVEELLALELPVTAEHHESAGAGQGGVDLGPAGLLEQADNVMWLKYVAKNVARRLGKTVTFMPKPLAEEAGSSMLTGQSLKKDGANLFAAASGESLPDAARWYLGGLLKHAAALCAFTNPTTNSYRRLAPGFDAPINIAWSRINRSVAAFVPAHGSPEARGIKFRLPDPGANPYLSFAAMLMAGLDGIENRIEPGEALDCDISQMSQEELARFPVTPASLEEALASLEDDCAFLMKGGVFSQELIGMWIDLKMEGEIAGARVRPTPWEFALYFDC